MGLRRLRSLVQGLPMDAAIWRVLAADTDEPAAPAPQAAPPAPARREFDLAAMQRFAAAHGGEVVVE